MTEKDPPASQPRGNQVRLVTWSSGYRGELEAVRRLGCGAPSVT
ncbi:hypothetical protein ERO13_A08G191200v2 [Gossypium hirsutum]|uniref:Uncharacterized protein n=3 Tax=Gossypium TaxID=3633 RepID=A0A5D2YCU7_GOSMU|nr:hypothetical protein ERO13_A08G191200v2 [Gossypium hirsutum]TYH07305.1 hypothetical protein ES288_A08G223600v1 [Gossypium darwinii]TYI15960.1 hypothetical protein ES332_A08G222900v1 [Gossypium tomentosum]TYJ23680.1 hypothetical protein E1A91_A08G209300v1 [Gossypium mustelinum]